MELARQVCSVLLVFGFLGAFLWAVRRRGAAISWRPQGRAKSLQSLQRLALTPQHSVHLIRIDGRELVVATHPQGCTILTETTRGTAA